MTHVVYFDTSKTPAPNNQHVQHFSHAFFATLRNKSATVPEVSGPAGIFAVRPESKAFSVTNAKLNLELPGWKSPSRSYTPWHYILKRLLRPDACWMAS